MAAVREGAGHSQLASAPTRFTSGARPDLQSGQFAAATGSCDGPATSGWLAQFSPMPMLPSKEPRPGRRQGSRSYRTGEVGRRRKHRRSCSRAREGLCHDRRQGGGQGDWTLQTGVGGTLPDLLERDWTGVFYSAAHASGSCSVSSSPERPPSRFRVRAQTQRTSGSQF
jgi:hypothetical protein